MSRANRWSQRIWLCVLAASGLVLQAANADEWKFEDANVGELPKGWSAAKTGEGPGSVWKVLADPTAPDGAKDFTEVIGQMMGGAFGAIPGGEVNPPVKSKGIPAQIPGLTPAMMKQIQDAQNKLKQ